MNPTKSKRPKGLKWCHIGADVWKYGRQKYINDKGWHMVIYGPDKKQHHLWNKDVFFVSPTEKNATALLL